MSGLRESKKQETRKRLSDLATAMFIERGFDNVSVAEVAEAAGVSKMTVFNYFPRKEDLVYDQVPPAADLIAAAVRERAADIGPVSAVREMALRLCDDGHPLAAFSDPMIPFCHMVLNSPALQARARDLADEGEAALAQLFAKSYPAHRAQLAAAMTMAAWRTAYFAGVRRILAGEPPASFAAQHRAWLVECFDAAIAAVEHRQPS